MDTRGTRSSPSLPLDLSAAQVSIGGGRSGRFGPRWRRRRRRRRCGPRQGKLSRQTEDKDLDGLVGLILVRLPDFDLLEIARALQLGDEIGHGIDGTGGAVDR